MPRIALFRTKLFQLVFTVAVMLGLSISFAIDSDNDGISDLYETIFKLNSNDASDASENYDDDGFSNLEEFAAWTDPMSADTDADGFPDHEDDNPLSRAVILWGYLDFTEGDTYRYTGPAWLIGAGKINGDWIAEDSAWSVAAGDTASVYVDLDRSILTEDVVLELGHLDVAVNSVSLSLLDINGAVLLSDISVAPTGATGEFKLDRYAVSLAAYPAASRIELTATAASDDYKVFSTIVYIDADGDGLDADQEKQLGTSDHSVDSDGDGLSDHREAIDLGTDPLKVDTDGDGVSDAQEIAFGSNPASIDGDGDGLTDAEEMAQRYFLSKNPLTWPEAKAFAEASGGHLAVITSSNEFETIKTTVRGLKAAKPWLGATDLEEDGVWKWITGEAVEYARWGEGEPNNYKQPEMYLRFMSNYYWSDAAANAVAPVLIEFPKGLDPNSADTDGDGLSDAAEIKIHKTNARAVDSDGDGISDPIEIARGLNPLKVDTDGDGLNDNEELDLGLNAADPDTDNDGLSDKFELDHQYQIVPTMMTWPEAKLFAEAAGGHLATFAAQEEFYASLSACTNAKAVSPWLGATDVEEEGGWKWVTGEEFGYARWAKGEPNNYKEPQMYLRMTKVAKWDDASADTLAGLMIEYSTGLDPKNPDCDGDGLSDGDEIYVHGSSARSVDTDGDGIFDADEVADGLNPISRDSDEDGIEDHVEIEKGLDPANPDTDGDGLSDGAEESTGYVLIETRMTWPEARQFAEESGGYLAVLPNAEEHYAALAACTNAKSCAPWLGATDIHEDGVWQWINGDVFDETRWATNEPNNHNGNQMYLRMTRKGQWDDMDEFAKCSVLIEYDGGLDPLNPDTDGDGLSDGDETLIYQSDARNVDTDRDGVADAEEIALGTNPSHNDSDRDTLADGYEISVSLDPANKDTDGDGLEDGAEPIWKYQVADVLVGWEDAKLVAENFGGHLAVVTSDEEIGAISRLLPTAKLSDPWIGAHEAREGVWQWVNGEAFDYTRWDKDEPNNYKGPESYVHFIGNSLKWNDAGDSVTKALLVEYAVGLDPRNPDSDADGLMDGEEINLYGTSAHDADSDNDGISDGDEIALSLDPLNADTDADGLIDGEERNEGLNPASAASDADGLNDGAEWQVTQTSPLMTDTDANGVEDLRIVQTINGSDFEGCYGPYWFSVWTNAGTSAELSAVCDGKPAIQYQVTIEQAGIYHLGLQVDLSQAHTNELNKLPVDLADILVNITIDGVNIGRAKQCFADVLPEYSIFTPWLSAGTHTVKVTFNKETYGITGPCWLEALEFGLVDGVDGNADGLLDWMGDLLNSGLDSDGDGISDADELELGTDILDVDADGDGLADGDELAAGTDPLNADSDGDGVSDGQEVNGSMTNPLIAEFDGTVAVVDAQSGAEASGILGEWIVDGSELKADSVRGHVEYVMNFPAGDMTRLVVNAAHEWNKSSCTPVIPIDESAFLVFVDDVYVGKFPMVSADGVYVEVNAFLPVLPAGEHTVKLYWENVHSRLAVKIQSLELQSLGGPDANGNGTKDWIEASIAAMAGVDAVTESYVSPACIEGDARYVEFMNVDGASSSVADAESTNAESNTTEQDAPSTLVRKGAGPRWYANLPLDQDDTTTATASFQNGALKVPVSIDWVPLNLMEHDGETIYVRKGDMVKFVALPEDANGGQFEIEYTLGMDGETVRSPNTRPLIYQFPSGGSYTVTGEYTKGNATISAAITVVAIDGSFPAENPACLVGQERTWSFEGMPSNVVYEADNTVEMSMVEQSLTTNNNQQTTVALKANDTNGDHIMLARLYPGGPVLDSVRLSPFWIQNAVDGYFYTVERYEDSELWEVRSVAKNVPDSVDIQIKVIIGGVTLDDYTLERWVTNADYSDIGEYNFRLFHPNGESSTCHTFKLYQNGLLIGDALSGNEKID